jgi:branched-chain amino acid transport system permease protein
MKVLRGSGALWLSLLIAVLVVLPLVVTSRFAIDIFIRVLLFAFIGVAWNLIGGYAKQLSLGHAAYFGLGAYTSTILQIDFGVSPWIGMVAGGIVAMLASLPIGALCFRLRGPYFAISTIATAQVFMLLFLKFRDFAWGAEGTTIPNLGNAPLMMQFNSKAAYYYIALGLLAIGLAITYRIERSWMGYYLVAIGEDEDAAEAIGVNAMRIKRDIYMISAFLTGLAGTFYTQYIYFIDPATAFNFNVSVEAALVSIVGGVGTLWGPVIGTVLLEATSALLQSWLGSSFGGVQLTVYALILMAVILWRPTGLLGVLTEIYARIARTGSAQPEKAALDG